jgi:tetratricopeptide (TPR) repeat protein
VPTTVTPEQEYSLGLECFERGDYGSALAHFEQVSSRRARHPNVWQAIGCTAIQTEDFPRARDALEKALALDPASLEACRWLAYACLRLEDFESAGGYAQHALGLTRDSALRSGLFAIAAYSQARLGNAAAAIAACRDALEFGTGDAVIHFYVGSCYEALGQPGLATPHVERACALEPENPDYRELADRVLARDPLAEHNSDR